jgi:hypothetical protein
MAKMYCHAYPLGTGKHISKSGFFPPVCSCLLLSAEHQLGLLSTKNIELHNLNADYVPAVCSVIGVVELAQTVQKLFMFCFK